MRGDRATQQLDVAILNVAAIAAQMNGDSLRARELANHGGGDRIGLVALPRFADGGDVIDVDCETHVSTLAAMTRRRIFAIAVVALVIAGAVSYGLFLRFGPRPRTVADVLAQYGGTAHARLGPYFKRAGVAYPPKRVALLVFKQERRLAVWVADAKGPWRYLRDYPCSPRAAASDRSCARATIRCRKGSTRSRI